MFKRSTKLSPTRDAIWNDIMEEKRRKEQEEKAAYERTPGAIQNKKMRKEMQEKFTLSETERLATIEELKKLEKYLLNHILSDLGLLNENCQCFDLDEALVDEVMTNYAANINYLKEKSLEFEKPRGNHVSYTYVKLYKTLISVNHIFIKYAPVEVFYSLGTLNGLDSKTIAQYKDLFITRGYFKDPRFREATKDHFTGMVNISSVRDYETLKKELVANPQLYPDVDEKMKDMLFDNKKTLKNLLRFAPRVIKYMTSEEIHRATDLMGTGVGSIIIEYPDVLDSFPTNFFSVHRPSFIFQGGVASRAMISERLSGYYDTFPELKEHVEKYSKSSIEDTTINNL